MYKVHLVPHYNADTLASLYRWCYCRQLECVRYSWWNYFTDLLERK